MTRPALQPWQARKVFAYIEKNISERIEVQHLADTVDLCKSHFSRMFVATMGVSPHAYIQLQRVKLAQHLLLTTTEPLSSIAITVGMCDQSHFTRAFRRIAGSSPGAWRHEELSKK